MGKSILDFTSINGRSGTEFTQVKGRSGTVLWCKPYILTLSSKPTGVDTITCYRYSSLQPGAATGPSAVLTNGSTIYHGDVIYISATASSGYKAPSISSSTGTISSNMLPVDGNESITVIAGELDVAPVYITAGTGVSSVFLSTNASATSGSASGSNFNIGSTVYGFAVLQTGYNPGSGWTLVSGSTYRVGSMTVGVSGNDFGTKSGSLKSFTISFSGTYCSWGSATKTAYYGDTLTVSGTTVTCSGTANWTNTCTKYSTTDQYSYGTPSISNGTGTVTGARTVSGTSSRTEKLYNVSFGNYSGAITVAFTDSSTIQNVPYSTAITTGGNWNGNPRTVTIGNVTRELNYTYDPYTNNVTAQSWNNYKGFSSSSGYMDKVRTGTTITPVLSYDKKPYGVKITVSYVGYRQGTYYLELKLESVSGLSYRGTKFTITQGGYIYTYQGPGTYSFTASMSSMQLRLVNSDGTVVMTFAKISYTGTKSRSNTYYSLTNSIDTWHV